MTLRLCETDRRVLDLMKDGGSVPAVARILKLNQRSVYRNVNKLCVMGYLRIVPGTKSPVLYEKGARYDDEMRARSSEEDVSCDIYGVGGTNRAPLPPKDVTRLHPTYAFPDNQPGVYSGDNCPDGFVEMHLNGGMSFQIEQEGTFDDPWIDGIGYVGYWLAPKENNGSQNYRGQINIDNQLVSFNFRVGNRGSKTFTLRPKRIFVDPKMYQSKAEAIELFKWRALRVATILTRTGWKLTNPKLDGQSDVEFAIQDHPLCQFIPMKAAGHDMFVDGSPETNPELEMKHVEDWEKVQIFADLPTHVQEAKATAKEAKEKAENVAQATEGVVTRLDSLDSILAKMVTVQEKTTIAVLNNTENITHIAKFDTDMAELLFRQRCAEYAPPNSLEGRLERMGYQ